MSDLSGATAEEIAAAMGQGSTDGTGEAQQPEESSLAPPAAELSSERLQELIALDRWVVENPDRAASLVAGMQQPPALEQGPSPAAAAAVTQPPALPPGVDLEDPTIRFIFEQNQRLEQALQGYISAQQQSEQNRGTIAVNDAFGRFQSAHPELTPAHIAALRGTQETNDLFVSYARSGMDPGAAAYKALEAAAWLDESSRAAIQQHSLQSQAEALRSDQKRQNNWSGLGGSARAASQQPTSWKGKTTAEIKSDMVAYLERSANGSNV